jgi:hypothetical protein
MLDRSSNRIISPYPIVITKYDAHMIGLYLCVRETSMPPKAERMEEPRE